uniref:Gustatory receptor n=1 Tax=Anopheles epiroticus TaxID=199890 RepID=A0A182PAJ3_9DIPT
MCVITFIVALQFIIYKRQLERDFAGWFISASVLSTTFIILAQALTSAKRQQFLMLELRNIESLTGATRTRRHFSAIFYCMYCVGVSRSVYRTFLLIQLGLRSPGFAVLMLIPSLILLTRVNQQIYLMELIASQLEAITTELSGSLGIEHGLGSVYEVNGDAYRCSRALQRTEYLFGRLQKCLTMVNAQFGWSTAVNEIKHVLLRPFYNAALWDQVHNFIVRTKLQPFEFTANGLYSINYNLFGSVSGTSCKVS